MKQVFFIGIILVSLFSGCGGSDEKSLSERPSQEELKEKIKHMEDSLKGLQSDLHEIKQIPNLTKMELINRLLDYYHFYPEDDKYSPECLDKVHMIYTSINVYPRASEYADTLLEKYPDYVNRAMVLESQGSTFDIFIQPRDSAKVRYYYEMLLKENPKMDKDKKQGIKNRLKYNHLSFDEFIEMNMSNFAKN
jgi:hypothetical protein